MADEVNKDARRERRRSFFSFPRGKADWAAFETGKCGVFSFLIILYPLSPGVSSLTVPDWGAPRPGLEIKGRWSEHQCSASGGGGP